VLLARRSGGIGLMQSRASSANLARIRSGSGVTGEATVLEGGGLSVTGSLSNFSLYIFHPYGGGGQKKTSLAALENTFRRTGKIFVVFLLLCYFAVLCVHSPV